MQIMTSSKYLVYLSILLGFVTAYCGETSDATVVTADEIAALEVPPTQLTSLDSQTSGLPGSSAEVVDRSSRELLNNFAKLHNNTYDAHEFADRLKIYSKRRRAIVDSQRMYQEHRSTFSMKEYSYVDWTQEEMSTLNGLSRPPLTAYLRDTQMAQTRSSVKSVQNIKLPESKDWRTSGCISTPMNQKGCNACYAVATVGMLEAMRCIKGFSSTVLSPQQVVDCDRDQHKDEFKNLGCNNGWPTSAILYLEDVGLVAHEKCYPYKNRRGACKFDAIKNMDGCAESVFLSNATKQLQYLVLRNEEDILHHVANTGPVVSAIETTDSWNFYEKGILDDPTCKRGPDDVDHAILIVGYGSENNLDYWIVKNSLGTGWGEDGYARVKRGINACSIGHWGWVLTD